jgi:hypothetical protein
MSTVIYSDQVKRWLCFVDRLMVWSRWWPRIQSRHRICPSRRGGQPPIGPPDRGQRKNCEPPQLVDLGALSEQEEAESHASSVCWTRPELPTSLGRLETKSEILQQLFTYVILKAIKTRADTTSGRVCRMLSVQLTPMPLEVGDLLPSFSQRRLKM